MRDPIISRLWRARAWARREWKNPRAKPHQPLCMLEDLTGSTPLSYLAHGSLFFSTDKRARTLAPSACSRTLVSVRFGEKLSLGEEDLLCLESLSRSLSLSLLSL